MHYFVRLGDNQDLEFDLGPDGLTLVDSEGGTAERLDARLEPIEGSDVWVLRVGHRVHRLVARRAGGAGSWELLVDGRPFEVEALDERARRLRDMTNSMAGASGPKPVVAPMPGLVVKVDVAVGDEVDAGQGVVIVEAMKMENELAAEAPGRVIAVPAVAGQAVEKGQVLVELEPLEAEGEGEGA
jgi:pyruvate carboxylase subunit B